MRPPGPGEQQPAQLNFIPMGTAGYQVGIYIYVCVYYDDTQGAAGKGGKGGVCGSAAGWLSCGGAHKLCLSKGAACCKEVYYTPPLFSHYYTTLHYTSHFSHTILCVHAHTPNTPTTGCRRAAQHGCRVPLPGGPPPAHKAASTAQRGQGRVQGGMCVGVFWQLNCKFPANCLKRAQTHGTAASPQTHNLTLFDDTPNA